MNLGIKQWVINFSNCLGDEWIFVIFSSVLAMINFLGLIYLYRKNLTTKARAKFAIANFIILALQGCFVVVGNLDYKLLFVTAFFSASTFLPFAIHEKKQDASTGSARNFAKNTLQLVKNDLPNENEDALIDRALNNYTYKSPTERAENKEQSEEVKII